jgi:basic amino acid/polyamine antiporter, APA family
MSSGASAHPLPDRPGEPASPELSTTDLKARSIGVTSATGLVIGSIIGTGVFAMPAVLAGAGMSSLVTLAVIAVGAMLLAVMFGQLTRRVPKADGGLYAYARHEFGDFAGYLTGWCYWIQAWAGNAAIVAAWVPYVEYVFNIKNPSAWTNWGIAMIGLWIPATINIAGVRQMAWFQNLTVVLKFLPLLFVGVVGWFFVKSGNFGAFNASGGSLYDAIGIAAGVALFSFIGVEVAAVTAKRVRNPRRNVGRASVYGTAASAILYLLAAGAVMGLVAHKALVSDTTPFATAFGAMFTGWSWAGTFVAVIAVISGIGALNGWTLVTAEVARAASEDSLFPFPKVFTTTDHKDTPWISILIAAILPSLLLLWSYNTSTGLKVFTYLVDLTVVTVAIPYLFSACAQLTYLVSGRRQVHGWLLARDAAIAGASVLFSLWVTFAAGYTAVYAGLLAALIGVILYVFLRASRERAGLIPAPVDLPAEEASPQPAGSASPAVAHRGHLRGILGGRHHAEGQR